MSLTRKFLSAMGIESDKIDEIITAHADTVDALKEERDAAKREAIQFKADAEKLPSVQKELDDLKNSQGTNPFEDKYNKEHEALEKLQEEFNKYKSDIDAENTKRSKEQAYRNLLKEIGISEKRIDSVLKVSDLESVELDKDGKIKDKENLTKSVKDEWSDFIVTESQQGAATPNPLSNNTQVPKGESRAAKIAAQYHSNLYGESNKEGN